MKWDIGELMALLKEHSELSFARSGGAGGQNVNKVSSKVWLRMRIEELGFFSDAERERLKRKLSSRLTLEGDLLISVQDTRDQIHNRALAYSRAAEILIEALKVEKLRHKTRPTRSSQEKRLKSKKVHSLSKKRRGTGDFD